LNDARGQLIDSMRREPTVLRAFCDALLGARRAGKYALLGEVVSNSGAYNQQTVVDWAEGSTQLISAECWEECGPWDESYFLYSEETDFDLRARDSGFATVFTPYGEATHLEGASGSSPGLWALQVLNKVRFYRRRNGLLRAVPFWFATVTREISRAVLGNPGSRAAAKALLSPARIRDVPGPHSIHE
jgi:N-acetylglucosaminyl-diphospho-decaprenol L-rhamnosyltransferase